MSKDHLIHMASYLDDTYQIEELFFPLREGKSMLTVSKKSWPSKWIGAKSKEKKVGISQSALIKKVGSETGTS